LQEAVILPVKFPQFFTGVYPALSLSLSRVWKPLIGDSSGFGVFMSSHAFSKFSLEFFR
jgi:hypothetical protein